MSQYKQDAFVVNPPGRRAVAELCSLIEVNEYETGLKSLRQHGKKYIESLKKEVY